ILNLKRNASSESNSIVDATFASRMRPYTNVMPIRRSRRNERFRTTSAIPPGHGGMSHAGDTQLSPNRMGRCVYERGAFVEEAMENSRCEKPHEARHVSPHDSLFRRGRGGIHIPQSVPMASCACGKLQGDSARCV